jgi:hypothetical protein
VTDYLDVPHGLVRRVRLACAHLPEAREEKSFAGVRWRIRGRTLVEVLATERGGHQVTFITFHAAAEELDALVAIGAPFAAGWGPGLVEMVVRDDGATDWDEVRELVTESYCLLAPKQLVARLEETRPDP